MLQLLSHLLDNALKLHSGAPLLITLSVYERDTHWLFVLRDTGIGLDMAYADRIFKPFQRLHDRDAYPGTGIGLAICKKIAERHNGKIWVESLAGEGATFNFTLKK